MSSWPFAGRTPIFQLVALERREYYTLEHLHRVRQYESGTPWQGVKGGYCKDLHAQPCHACISCHFCRFYSFARPLQKMGQDRYNLFEARSVFDTTFAVATVLTSVSGHAWSTCMASRHV